MNIAVIVASVNRADETGQLLKQLARQSLQPAMIVLSVERQADLPPLTGPNVQIIMGPKGLTLQRNRGLETALPDNDIIVFFDDDFLPADNALEGIARLFAENHDVIGATGLVIIDGINKGGLSYEAAIAALDEFHKKPAPAAIQNIATDEAYGCNMAFRTAAIGNSRFDENLPLYAWQEDVDFAGQLLAKQGRMVKTTAFAGVHRGVTKGRSPGVPLGFSQMVNPAYMVRKGTMRPAKAASLMVKNFTANHAKAIRPEKFIDRAGRARGNWLGLWHIIAGNADPKLISKFAKP